MAGHRQQFVDTLARYPHLAKLLNRKAFVEKWSVGDPLYCGHDLAWWIHNGDLVDAAEILATLDRVIGNVVDLPGLAAKLTDVREDPEWTWGHLVELYTISSLVDAEAAFTLPASGADLGLIFNNQPFALEITCLRRARWFPRLHERLGMLGDRMSVEFDYAIEPTTHQHFDERAQTSAALRRVLDRLNEQITDNLRSGLISGLATVGQYGFSTEWRKVYEPQWLGGGGPRKPNELFGAKLVMDAVRKKARQLPSGRAGCVLVDATNDEGGHVKAIQRRMSTIDWAEFCHDIPEEAKHVLVCAFSAKTGRPTLYAHLERTESPYSTPDGFGELLDKLFRHEPASVPQWWTDLSDLATLAAEE